MQEAPPTSNDFISWAALVTAIGALGKAAHEWLKRRKEDKIDREDRAFNSALSFMDRLEKANADCARQLSDQTRIIEDLQRRMWKMEYLLKSQGIEVPDNDSSQRN
jgi:hypothetical protein